MSEHAGKGLAKQAISDMQVRMADATSLDAYQRIMSTGRWISNLRYYHWFSYFIDNGCLHFGTSCGICSTIPHSLNLTQTYPGDTKRAKSKQDACQTSNQRRPKGTMKDYARILIRVHQHYFHHQQRRR